MIHIDVSDITGHLLEDAKLTDELVSQVARKMGLDLQAGLIAATPRDKGIAANGWQLDTSGNEVVVENQVPYIGVLNDGHSKQAPAGFVEDQIDRVTRG